MQHVVISSFVASMSELVPYCTGRSVSWGTKAVGFDRVKMSLIVSSMRRTWTSIVHNPPATSLTPSVMAFLTTWLRPTQKSWKCVHGGTKTLQICCLILWPFVVRFYVRPRNKSLLCCIFTFFYYQKYRCWEYTCTTCFTDGEWSTASRLKWKKTPKHGRSHQKQ